MTIGGIGGRWSVAVAPELADMFIFIFSLHKFDFLSVDERKMMGRGRPIWFQMRRRFLKGVNVRVEEQVAGVEVEMEGEWEGECGLYWNWKLADEGLGEREKYLVKWT